MPTLYRVYLRDAQQHVYPETKTQTGSRAVALSAFSELVARTDLDGQKLAAVLSCNNGQLAFHRFDHPPGTAQDWRGRLNEIPRPDESH